MNKVKVCHIVNSIGIGGVEKFVLELSNRLNPSLFDVHIISLSKNVSLIQQFDLKDHIKVTICEYKFSQKFTLLELYRHAYHVKFTEIRAVFLEQVIQTVSPDIIHAHVLPRELTLIKLIAAKCNGRILYTDHSVRLANYLKFHNKILFAFAFMKLYKGINTVSVSKTVHNINKKFRVFDNNRLNTVIENSIPLTRYKKSEKHELPIKIVYVSRISNGKGHEDLIKAWSQISNRSKLLLQIIGPDEMYGTIQKLSNDIIQDCSVEFLGSIHNVSEYLKKTDIGVFPSHREGLPLALLEKMSYSLPVIASDIPELKDIITNGYNGLLFKTGDAGDLNNKIQLLLNSESIRTKLGENARRTVANRFNIVKMVEQYENVYKNLVNGKERKG